MEATSLPEVAAVAENLRASRTTLSSDDSEPAEVGRILNVLGDQVRVAATPSGLTIALPLAQLSLLLDAGSVNLAGQARS